MGPESEQELERLPEEISEIPGLLVQRIRPPARMGKSTFAQTVVGRVLADDHLGAFKFFCLRGE